MVPAILSVFVMLSYYEASILASVGRYLGCIHVALIFLVINYIISENFINSKKIFGIEFNKN